MVSKDSWWYPFHYHIIPPGLIIFFVFATQYLAIIGQGQEFTWDLALSNSLGDASSWKWTSIFCIWALIWLKVPSKVVYGPETMFGYRPPYRVSAGSDDSVHPRIWNCQLFVYFCVSSFLGKWCSVLLGHISHVLPASSSLLQYF